MNRIHRLFFKLTDQFISFGFEQFAVFCVLWGGGSIFTLFQMRRWMCLCFMRWFNDENEINDECNQLSFVYLMLSSQWHSINNTKNNCHKIEHIPYIKVCVCKMTIRIDSHSWSIFFSFCCFFLRWELLLNLLLLLFGFYNSILITIQSSKAHWPGPFRNSKWTRGIMMSFGWNSVRLRSIPFALQINYTKFPSEKWRAGKCCSSQSKQSYCQAMSQFTRCCSCSLCYLEVLVFCIGHFSLSYSWCWCIVMMWGHMIWDVI